MPLGVFAVALVILIAGAAGGPGWDAAAGHATLAAHLERTAAAPLHGALAGAFAQLPFGEVGFRLAVLAAVLGALTLAGVVRATQALVPKAPLAWLAGSVLLALAPPFRDATGFADPASLAACGGVWALAAVIEHARAPSPRTAALAIAMVAVVLGSAPWLGVALGALVVVWLARTGASRQLLALGIAALGALVAVLWIATIGRLPGVGSSLTAMVRALGPGSAAVLVGAGLLGVAFGAATRLPRASWLALALLVAVVHALVIQPAPAIVLALLAVGVAILPSAVCRALPELPAIAVVLAATAPLVGVALLSGPQLGVDDPGDAPTRLATDVIGELPPGPGVIVARSGTVWAALHYEQRVAGARPDLTLAPPAPAEVSDVIIANALRAKQIAGADVPAFGRLLPDRALPRGRGFQLRGEPTAAAIPPPPPAGYASAIGEEQAVLLALARARYEAGSGRLDAAARAAGLTSRFRAADLALLSMALPSRERPALYGFIPRLDERRAGRWVLELFGDDLAWVGGLPPVALPEDAPPARRLHALWRQLLTGELTADDPAIAALGPAAVTATREMLAIVRPATPATDPDAPAGDTASSAPPDAGPSAGP